MTSTETKALALKGALDAIERTKTPHLHPARPKPASPYTPEFYAAYFRDMARAPDNEDYSGETVHPDPDDEHRLGKFELGLD